MKLKALQCGNILMRFLCDFVFISHLHFLRRVDVSQVSRATATGIRDIAEKRRFNLRNLISDEKNRFTLNGDNYERKYEKIRRVARWLITSPSLEHAITHSLLARSKVSHLTHSILRWNRSWIPSSFGWRRYTCRRRAEQKNIIR